jgi:GH24 family phage-related lysozyme (muramidase)
MLSLANKRVSMTQSRSSALRLRQWRWSKNNQTPMDQNQEAGVVVLMYTVVWGRLQESTTYRDSNPTTTMPTRIYHLS